MIPALFGLAALLVVATLVLGVLISRAPHIEDCDCAACRGRRADRSRPETPPASAGQETRAESDMEFVASGCSAAGTSEPGGERPSTP